MAALGALLSSLLLVPAGAQETVLFNFPAGGNSGYAPTYGSLNLVGSTLYGTTIGGGGSNLGVLFSVGTNGTGYTMLHEFAGGSTDGSTPYSSSLAVSGSTLYGMTRFGGSSNLGGIYRMNTDGTGFSLLRSFDGTNDGSRPWGSVSLSGSKLFGMTYSGGYANSGTLFSMNTDGSDYAVLHEFSNGAGNAQNPRGDLLLSGSTLFGMSQLGGANSVGAIFKIQTDGTGFTVLHDFAPGANGSSPMGTLTLVGSTLYGLTSQGGPDGAGVIFRMDMDGSNFDLLHTFQGGPEDGASAYGSLTLAGSQLFGLTSSGNLGNGTFFSINLDGTGYSNLVLFGGADGSKPFGSVISDGTNLYGMTSAGGTWGNGVIFSYPAPIPEPGTYALLAGLLGLSVAAVRRSARAG